MIVHYLQGWAHLDLFQVAVDVKEAAFVFAYAAAFASVIAETAALHFAVVVGVAEAPHCSSLGSQG